MLQEHLKLQSIQKTINPHIRKHKATREGGFVFSYLNL